MKRPLFTQLLLPLVVATALSILVHRWCPADGFFMNLAAGFVGTIVTVGYIDWILKRHEEERWSATDSRISSLLRTLATETITGIRTSFGYGTEIFDRRAWASRDIETMRLDVIRIATRVLSPEADAKIASLDQQQWKFFVTHMQLMSMECGAMLDRFGPRLQPKTMEILLDLQQSLRSAQFFWRVFPDIAGVTLAQFPQAETPAEAMQADWCENTARDVRKVLDLAAGLAAQ